VSEFVEQKADRERTCIRGVSVGLLTARILVAWLIIVSVSLGIPMAIASGDQAKASSAPTLPNGTGFDVAAAVDSKGIVHAAWVEHGDPFAGSTNATPWYSTYDPESSSSRSTRRLDTHNSIYSLSMAIGNLDDVHIVWVRKRAEARETSNLTTRSALENPSSVIYYQEIRLRGASADSPRPVLESHADALWASIAAGHDSELYLAWLSVRRSGSTDAESDVYYARLSPHDGTVELAGTLVTKTSAPSRLLRVASSIDRENLHIAWVEETEGSMSRVVEWDMDLGGSGAETVSVNDVSGRISQLTLAAIQNGEVVLGWAYRESAGDNPKMGVARFPEGRNGIARIVEIPLSGAEEPESISIDPQGNLHVVWAYSSEDIRAGTRPVSILQQGFRHAEYGDKGRLTGETQETSYLPVAAVFVVGSGQLYVVSEEGTLRIADRVRADNPAALLVAVAVLVSLAGGMSTEPGEYLVASWSASRSLRTYSPEVNEKLLRRIRKRPGIALAELKSLSKGSEFSIAGQLRAVEKSGLISSRRDGLSQRFYCVAPDDRNESHAEELRRRILCLVNYTPGITEAEISKSLGTSQQLTNYHLRRLVDAKVLLRGRVSDRIEYRVKDRILAHLGQP